MQNLALKCGPQLVADVHFVQWGYDSSNPKWEAGLQALRQAGIPFYAHSELDDDALQTLQSKAVVRLDPALFITDGALRRLVEQMASRSSWSVLSADHFAMSSEIWITPNPRQKPQLGDWATAALAYGWLLVVLVLDTLRFWLNFGAYHRNADLTGRLVSTTFPNRTVLAPHRWWSFWGGLGSGIALPLNGAGVCLLVPNVEEQGMSFVTRLVRTHRSMGWGLWLFGFALYYCCFAFPWWSALLPQEYLPFWWMRQLSLNPLAWPWWWQLLQAFHLLIVTGISLNQLHVPWGLQPLHILLYPLFLASAPVFFFVARESRSRALHAENIVQRATVPITVTDERE